jgi:hypothetical protein
MKRNYFVFLLVSIGLVANCQESGYSPWGLWNKYPVSTRSNITVLGSGKFYEAGDSGMAVTQKWDRRNVPERIPCAFAIVGMYNRIEKFEETEDGFIFYLVGQGIRKNPNTGKMEWQNDTHGTHVIVQMHFVSKDECYFYLFGRDG